MHTCNSQIEHLPLKLRMNVPEWCFESDCQKHVEILRVLQVACYLMHNLISLLVIKCFSKQFSRGIICQPGTSLVCGLLGMHINIMIST